MHPMFLVAFEHKQLTAFIQSIQNMWNKWYIYHRTCITDGFQYLLNNLLKWTASSKFGTYHLCEQWRFRRACAFAQSRQNLRCSLIQAVNQEEPSDRKSDPWPLWMVGHAQLKFVMMECSKTQIRLTGLKCCFFFYTIGLYFFNNNGIMVNWFHRIFTPFSSSSTSETFYFCLKQ